MIITLLLLKLWVRFISLHRSWVVTSIFLLIRLCHIPSFLHIVLSNLLVASSFVLANIAMKYPHPSHIHAPFFVTIRLHSKKNFVVCIRKFFWCGNLRSLISWSHKDVLNFLMVQYQFHFPLNQTQDSTAQVVLDYDYMALKRSNRLIKG